MSQAQDGSGIAGLTDDEFDQLADYVADAIDPIGAAAIDRLIAEEPRWAAAHAELSVADRTVRELLADPGMAPGPMPADVATRLDDALQAAASAPRSLERLPDAGPSPSSVSTHVSSATGAPAPANVVSISAARARRRRLATTMAAVAAAVVAIVGGGAVLSSLASSRSATATSAADSGRGSQAGAPAGGEAVPPAVAFGAPGYLASGTDYTVATLPRLALVRGSAMNSSPNGFGPQANTKDGAGGPPDMIREAAPDSLTRLLDPGNLATCLGAIRTVFSGTAATVDFARFEGSPAVVVLVQSTGGTLVVAAGPDCGLGGADVLGSAQVR